MIPGKWEEYSFKISFKGSDLFVVVDKSHVHLKVYEVPVSIKIYGKEILLKPGKTVKIPTVPYFRVNCCSHEQLPPWHLYFLIRAKL